MASLFDWPFPGMMTAPTCIGCLEQLAADASHRCLHAGLDVYIPLLIDTLRVGMTDSGRVARCPRDRLT
jgi:hypothetical protein